MSDAASPAPAPAPEPVPEPELDERAPNSRRITAEIWIVLGLSLGQSAVYAIVNLLDEISQPGSLSSQTTALNPSQSSREYWDLLYQLLSIGFALVPVALAIFLLSGGGRSARKILGLDGRRPGRDLAAGVGLAALIGIPGLAFYILGRIIGVTVQVQASALDAYWWTIPVLILSAIENAILEEVLVVGYLLNRLRELRWGWPAAFAASALLRGSYHLYQGPASFVGNAIMGLVFCEYYRRSRRVGPLIAAHALIDIVAFVGYDLLPDSVLKELHLT